MGWRTWIVSATAGAVWLAVVLLAAAVSLTPLWRLQQALLPNGATPYVFSWVAPWPVLLPLAGALAVALVLAAILHLVRVRGPFATTWLAAVAAGAAAGLAVDAVLVFGNLVTNGWAMWVLELGSRAASGAYWGLLYGWIPSIVAVRLHRGDAGQRGARRGASALVAAAAVAALALLGVTEVAGNAATQEQLLAEQAAIDPAPADGSARPDPDAAGDPVPARADGAGVPDADGCTSDRAMVLAGMPDGATGHRGLRLELMNFSDAPCVIEGYPDVAFGDQNDHALAVVVEHGGSFMAADPGQARVEIPAGGSAVAYLGWDANSTHGILIARTLWTAALPGEIRGSTPLQSDIVEGSAVSITAWALPVIESTP